ncbi:hypothetical protein VTJ49DRAFT_6466 [Mycothermus thermophilus]|uniref:Cytochrome P450 n=1 Tax=Humicola insolens TaxID=85995 RepID=A0ABR3VJH3_HUMIN
MASPDGPGLAGLVVALVALAAWQFVIYPAAFSPLASIPSAHCELSVSDLDAVRTVYQGGFDKPVWYSVFDNYGVPCMFSTRGMAEHSARLLPILEDSISGPSSLGVVDVYSVFMAATMDFIACYIFGLRNGTDFLRDKAYRDHFLELYKARNDYGIYDQELPWLTKWCRRLGVPLCPKWVDGANRELGEWCRRLCDAIVGNGDAGISEGQETTSPGDHPVVWRALVSGLKNEEAKNGPSSILYPTALTNFRLSIASELFDHVLAGQETAGLTLTYLAWRLSQSPELQAQLRAELLTLSPSLRVPADGTAPELPDPKQLDSLPLLHAVLMETLRLHAPIPGAQPRQTPEQGCRIGPYEVHGGIRIAAMAYTLHRDEVVFPEPLKWDPTRWLPSAASDEERRQRNRQFWAFSSGGRMCIGSNFAMHEMKLVTAAIYSNYTTHVVDDAGMENPTDGLPSNKLACRLHEISRSICRRYNALEAQGNPSRAQHRLVVRGYSKQLERNAFMELLRNPRFDQPVEWHWQPHLSVVYWLLVVSGAKSDRIPALHPDDSQALHDLSAKASHCAALKNVRAVVAGQMTWQEFWQVEDVRYLADNEVMEWIHKVVDIADTLCTT